MSEPLVLQAQAWLARVNAGDLTSERHPELLNLALACHQRMLELGEHDRAAAVELAVVGADLLQAFQRHTPPGSTVPEWVLVHEEQCCRYGAIWMHAEAEADEQLSTTQLQQGLSLLNRLTQLHQEPPPWIDIYRSNLETLLKSQTALQHQRLVIVGNCQAHPLMLGLRDALPDAVIHFCPSVHLATSADVERLHNRLGSADILITHRIQPGYRDNIGLDSQTLKNLLPAESTAYILPNLHYEGHHPWIGYAQIPAAKSNLAAQESPLGDYHDFLAMTAAAQGMSGTTLLNATCNEAMAMLLQRTHQQSLTELKQREADCDIQISDWINKTHQTQPLVHTINHPTQALLDELLQRLLRRMGRSRASNQQAVDNHEHLGSLSIPIHPWVSAALQLNAWHRTWGQKEGKRLEIEQQLQQSLSFYQRHPWILQVNANHPKALLAAELLANLTSRSAAQSLDHQPEKPAPSITETSCQRTSDNKPKRLEINYAFLDPRHDFNQPNGINPSTPSPEWDQPLHTYRIGWRLEQHPLILPVGVITEHGWLSDCLQYLPPNWASTAWMQSVGGFQLSFQRTKTEGQPEDKQPEALLLTDQAGTAEQELAGQWCILNDIVAHRNLGHFFHDLLPQLMAIRRLRKEWPSLQVMGSPEQHPNLRILREILLEDAWQPRPSHQRLRVDELVLQPLAFNGGIGFLNKSKPDWWLATEDLREGLQWLRQKLAPDPNARWNGHWLCFSRDLHRATEAPQGRIFSNYPQFLERLSNAGVLIVDPGRHDIRHLQLLVSGARGFIGIHGAGLFNALLGEEGARIIEIRPACGCWRTVELTSKVARLTWAAVACEPDQADPERSVIPINTVMDLLD